MSELLNPSRRRCIGQGLALAAGALTAGAGAQEVAKFPSRLIKFIVPFPAGSGTDATARLYAHALGEVAGQSVIVENKPGANGIIAAQAVLAAPADGYTILLGSNSTLSTNVAVYKKLPYDPVTDFTPLTVIEGGHCMVVVPSASPYRTLGDLIADARKRPTALNHAAGSPTYALWAEWMGEAAGIKTTNIVYKGSGEAVNAVVGGQVDYGIIASELAAEMVRGGRLRALAFAGEERYPLLPEVPLASDEGAPGFSAFAWSAAAVSAKTPPAIAQALEALFMQAAGTKALKARRAMRGEKPMPIGGARMRQYQIEEIARWKRMIAASGIELQ